MTRRREDPAVEAVRAHRRLSDRILDRTVMRPMTQVFEEQSAGLFRGLTRSVRGRMSQPADSTVIHTVAGALDEAFTRMGSAFGRTMGATGGQTITESLRALQEFLRKVTPGSGSPLTDSRVAEIQQRTRHAIEVMRQRAAAELTTDMREAVFGRIFERSASAAERTIGELLSQTGEVLDDQLWRVERIARTQASDVFNGSQVEGMQALVREDPRYRLIRPRWTELISDLNGEPFDSRVAADSFAMHGQVRELGEGVFVMPAGRNVPPGLVGKTWTHPPNRPNDRAVIVPWLPTMPIPAWKYENGQRVPVSGAPMPPIRLQDREPETTPTNGQTDGSLTRT